MSLFCYIEINTDSNGITDQELIYYFERLTEKMIFNRLMYDIDVEVGSLGAYRLFPVPRLTDNDDVQTARNAEIAAVLAGTRVTVSGTTTITAIISYAHILTRMCI